MFQAVISASVIGLPRPGVSATAVFAPKARAKTGIKTGTRTSAKSLLCVDMLDPPRVVDAPAGDAVVVLVRERERARDRLVGLPARGHELGAQRLHVAGLVPC